MDEENIITSVTNREVGVDSFGSVEETIGYTNTKQKVRTESTLANFDNPETIDASDKKCYAKKVKIKTSKKDSYNTKYYVSVSRDGFIFDPWGMFSEGTESDYDKNKGRSKWSFKEVNENCFNYYLRFLQSRNSSWLKNANREIR